MKILIVNKPTGHFNVKEQLNTERKREICRVYKVVCLIRARAWSIIQPCKRILAVTTENSWRQRSNNRRTPASLCARIDRSNEENNKGTFAIVSFFRFIKCEGFSRGCRTGRKRLLILTNINSNKHKRIKYMAIPINT